MIARAQLAAIAAKHTAGASQPPEPWTGATSRYPLGDVVLKAAFDRPDAVAAVAIDAAMATFARLLGVAVPIALREFRQSPGVDPRPWVDELQEAGALSLVDARWLRRCWTDRTGGTGGGADRALPQ